MTKATEISFFVIHTSLIDLTRKMDLSQAHLSRKAYTLSKQLSMVVATADFSFS
jgi:hypothetical protein